MVTVELQTRGAQILARMLPLHEEHQLLEGARWLELATSHVGDAARLACDAESADLDVAVPLAWASVACLRGLPDRYERLGSLDEAVADRAPTFAGRSRSELVTEVTARLGPETLFDAAVAAITAAQVLERG